MIHVEKLGIYLSKPISVLLVTIYLIQSGLLIYLIRDKFELERQINFQQKRISELEERLQIFKAVEQLQIGFTEEETIRLSEVIFEESKKYNYDPLFVMAIILAESSFRKGQTSHMGARGLMQLIPYVGMDVAKRTGMKWTGMESLFEPEKNIKLGTLHLFEQVLEFGDIEKAIVSYNVGETHLRGLIRQGKQIPESYLKKVLGHYQNLKENYAI